MLQACSHMAKMPFKQDYCNCNRITEEIRTCPCSSKPLFDPAGSIGPPMFLFVCAVFSQTFRYLLCFSFLWISFSVRDCMYVDGTHLHCKKTICIRENAIGVNMALEPSKTKLQCYWQHCGWIYHLDNTYKWNLFKIRSRCLAAKIL